MPLEVTITDEEMIGFSEPAQSALRDAVREYSVNLIEEANRIEAGRNSTSGSPEVTRGMVNDAKELLKRGLGIPRKRWGIKLLRIVAGVLPLVVGIMYNETRLTNPTYMGIFVVVVALAILAVTLSTLLD